MSVTTTRERASANEKLRLEPTALPTRLIKSRIGLMGWHPVALPVMG